MEEIIYNTYEEDLEVYGDFNLPVPTYEMDKKIDFSVIIALLLRSNSNTKTDNHRYIECPLRGDAYLNIDGSFK